MNRAGDRPPFDASPAKRASRLVIRKKPSESRGTIFNQSPSPGRTSVGRGSNLFKGSVTISGSLKVRSPRVQARPTILPSREASTQTLNESKVDGEGKNKENIDIDRGCKLRTEIRYDASPPSPPIKSVRFADPAIIYASKPAFVPSSIEQPAKDDLMVTLQRFLSLDTDDRNKLQNILRALNIPDHPVSVPVSVPEIPILTPTSTCDTPIEGPKLNPEAPSFRDFSKLKENISPRVDGTKNVKLSCAKVVSTPTIEASNVKLNWKMSPEKTWGGNVHQRLAETRRNTRVPARPRTQPALTLQIPVEASA